MSVMADLLVRTIKESPEIIKGLQTGAMEIFGGVIRIAKGQDGAGQIVAHLRFPDQQEALQNSLSQLQQAMSQQLGQVQNGLSSIQSSINILQGLQVANLALSGLNLAVSVAGFVIVCQKLNAIAATLKQHSQKLDMIINMVLKGQQRESFKSQATFTSLLKTLQQYSAVNDFQSMKLLVQPLIEQYEMNKLVLLEAVGSQESFSNSSFKELAVLQERLMYLGIAIGFVSAKTASKDQAIKHINELEETLTEIRQKLVKVASSDKVLLNIHEHDFLTLKSITSFKKEILPALEYQKQTLTLITERPELESVFLKNTNEILLIAA